MKSLQNTSKFKCPKCRRCFRLRDSLRQHLYRKRKAGENLDCRQCGKRFCDVSSFTRHVRVHSDKRERFVCDKKGCGYSTNRSFNMKEHHVTHTGKRPHLCPFRSCNKAFGLVRNLKRHMLTCELRNLDAEAPSSSSSSIPSELREPSAELKQSENRVAIRTKPSISKTIKTLAHTDCNVSVLWCLQISKKLQAHREQQDKLFTKPDIGKMLSNAVLCDNPNMNWNTPFLLLDVALDLGDQPEPVVENNMYIRIPVFDKSTATSSTTGPIPATKRLWQLELSHCLIDVGKEMLRRPDISKTIMIWGARSYWYNSLSMGVIRLDNSAAANLLIFREIRDYETNDTVQIDLSHWNHRIQRNHVDEIAAVHLSNIKTHNIENRRNTRN